MTLEQQVTSFEISQRLKELDVKQESLWYWQKSDIFQRWIVCPYADDGFKNSQSISAFTVSELGEKLPMEPKPETYFETMKTGKGNWMVTYTEGKGAPLAFQESDTEADARGKMLIYLLENKLM